MMRILKFAALGALLTGAAFVSANVAMADTINVTVEAPGQENTTATFSDGPHVEDFNSLGQSAQTTFSDNFGGSSITGTWSNFGILGANVYGGAGGSGNYVADYDLGDGYSYDNAPAVLALSSSVNYFGVYISALDASNIISLYSGGIGGTLIASYDQSTLLALIGANPAYNGNPDCDLDGNPEGAACQDPFGEVPTNNPSQSYAFFNFFDTDGTFDTIVFSSDGEFESDNHTVGTFSGQSGTGLGNEDVPEPASLAILGAGLIGIKLLRRNKKA